MIILGQRKTGRMKFLHFLETKSMQLEEALSVDCRVFHVVSSDVFCCSLSLNEESSRNKLSECVCVSTALTDRTITYEKREYALTKS